MERINNILEVDEDAARCFRSKVRNRRLVFSGTNMRLEHHVELTSVAKRTPTFGTFSCPERFILSLIEGSRRVAHLIRAKPSFTLLTFNERV